jgi:hypothetical protein
MSVGTELWAAWAQIALAQTEVARQGRANVASRIEAGEEFDLNGELYPAMVAISAAVTSLDGFATLVQDTGVVAAAPSTPHPSRAHYVWEILRAGFDVGAMTNTWPRDLKDLFVLRSDRTSGGLFHPKTVFGEAVNHPLVPGVSPARALYTVETADKAIAFMRDIYARCKVSVRPDYPELERRIEGLAGVLDQLLRRD